MADGYLKAGVGYIQFPKRCMCQMYLW